MHIAHLLLVLSVASIAWRDRPRAQAPSTFAGCYHFDSVYFRWWVLDRATRRITEYASDTFRLLAEAHTFRSEWADA